MKKNLVLQLFIAVFIALPAFCSDHGNNGNNVIFIGNEPLYLTLSYKKRLRDTDEDTSKESSDDDNKRLKMSNKNAGNEQSLIGVLEEKLNSANWTCCKFYREMLIDDCIEKFWQEFIVHNDSIIREINESDMRERMLKNVAMYSNAKNFISFAEFHYNGSTIYHDNTLYWTLVALEKIDSRKSTYRVFNLLPEQINDYFPSYPSIDQYDCINFPE